MSGVWLDLSVGEADALEAAADYLTGFGRALRLLDEDRGRASDLRLVVETLRQLHARVEEIARAA